MIIGIADSGLRDILEGDYISLAAGASLSRGDERNEQRGESRHREENEDYQYK